MIMKKFLLLIAAAFSFSALFSQILYEDDFESYSVGDYIAVENPTWWTTWTNQPGSAEDAMISDEQGMSGTQSLKVDGTTDAILKLGNKIVGKYQLSFKYYVPSGFAGYFNVQHFEAPGTEWAYEVYFGATGSGYLDAGSASVAGFDYDQDTWVDIVSVIDLDADWTQLYIDGTLIYEWPFSWQSTSQSGTLQLGGVDVFAGGPTGETPTYYMDDLVFESVPSALYADDFESYTSGDYLAVVNPEWWTTWTNQPGTAEDALITDAQSNSGSNSVIVEGTTDLIMKLGDKTSGSYELSFWMYVPAGFGGHYNIQHFESPGTEWAFEMYFASDGTGYLNAGVANAATFTYSPDTWFYVDQIMNLNDDLAQLYLDGTLLFEWPFSYQASSTTGTLQLGGVDFYAGAPGSDTPTYYFDDIEFTQLEPGTGAAIINLDPATIIETLNAGSSSTNMINIENTGEVALDYSIVVTYPEGGKKSAASNGNPHKVVLSNVPAQSAMAKPGGAPEATDDVVLNYDGDNFSAIGLTNGGPMRVAANFTSDLVNPYIGMMLSSIEVYINDMPISTMAKVYDYGTIALPGPGEMLAEQSWTPVATNWQTVDLNDPIIISGGDIWVGYEVDHDAATFPAGTDGGPHHPQGDWISTGPGWHHLSDNAALDYNWNIRATLTGDPIEQWLSVDPMSGTVDVGDNMDIDVMIDATNLEGGNTYHAELVFNNTDPVNPQMIVPVTLAVFTGINEYSNSYIAVYPNPATNYINVKGDQEIYSVELINLVGQQVYRSEVNQLTHTIVTDNLQSGVYLLKVELENGTVTQRVTVK